MCHVRSVLSSNSYPRSIIDKVECDQKNKRGRDSAILTVPEYPVATASIPCVATISEKRKIAEHTWKEGSHVIRWNDQLLDFSQSIVERRVKEAIYINLSPNNLTMNRDKGMELSPLVVRPETQINKHHP